MTARRGLTELAPARPASPPIRAMSTRGTPGGDRAKVRTASASALVSSHASVSRASASASARSGSRIRPGAKFPDVAN